jgi:hypothetical protein
MEVAMSPEEWKKKDRDYVEWMAVIAPGKAVNELIGEARADLVRRDLADAEEQERSRRQYEDDRAATRRDHEEQLARQQTEHASKLAQEQLATAGSAARAANRAAWAAGFAALGAIVQAGIAVLQYCLPPHG